MRQSTANIILAFCSSVAVSAAPLSPNPPVSPALTSPLVLPRADVNNGLNIKEIESSIQQKRSVDGFSYHKAVDKRTTDKATTLNQYETEASDIKSDLKSVPQSDSESYFDAAMVPEYNDTAIGSDIEKRTVANPPSPQVTAEDFGEESGAASDDVYSAESNDDSFSIASDDEFSALASDDEESGYFENDAQSSQATSAPNSPIDDKKAEKIEKRGIDIGGESDRHGGRYYMSETKWNS